MPSQKFKSQTFLVIIDSLLFALPKCQKAHQKVKGVFGFLHQLQSYTCEEIVKRSSNLIKSYPEDQEENLDEEFVQFTETLKTDLALYIGTKQDIVDLVLPFDNWQFIGILLSKCRNYLAHLFVTHGYQLQCSVKTEKD